MAARSPAVSVIVPATAGAAGTLPETLAALAAQELDGRPFEVIVVDDGAPDGARVVAERSALAPRVVTRDAPGAGAARNKGAAAARAAILAFTDADCAPAPQWLAEGLRAAERADLVQGAVLPAAGVPLRPWDRTLAVVSEYGLYETANLFVRRDWFERVGGFADWLDDRKEPRPFGEDVWLAWRLRRAGARTTFASDALVRHAVFPGTPAATIAERARDRHFPALVRRIPELRGAFLYRRTFLSRRSAAFDLALAGAVAAAARRSPLPLVLAAPYVRELRREAARWRGESRPVVMAVTLAGDVVGAAGLAYGSAAARTPVF